MFKPMSSTTHLSNSSSVYPSFQLQKLPPNTSPTVHPHYPFHFPEFRRLSHSQLALDSRKLRIMASKFSRKTTLFPRRLTTRLLVIRIRQPHMIQRKQSKTSHLCPN